MISIRALLDALASAEPAAAQSGLVQRLAARRAEIRDEQWSRFPELRTWVTAGWTPPVLAADLC